MSVMVSITIIILLSYSFIGLRKGLVKSVLSFGTVLLSLFIANVCYGQVSKMIQNYTDIDDIIEKNISETIVENMSQYVNSNPEQKNAIEELNLIEDIQKLLIDNNNADVYSELQVTEFSEYVGNLLSLMVINGIAYLLTYFIVILFCKILLKLAGVMTDFPIIGWVDGFGGLILGCLKGLVFVWLIYFFVTMCATTTWGMTMFDQIQENTFTKMIYDNNILTSFLYNLSKTLF